MPLILRKDLTRPLTHDELDGNLEYLSIEYWQKQPYDVGKYVIRDVGSNTILYYCALTHNTLPYDSVGGGGFIDQYIDGVTGLPVILWKMVGGVGEGGTITGATNLVGAPTQSQNADTYTQVYAGLNGQNLTFKTLQSPDGSITIKNDNGTIYLSLSAAPITPVVYSTSFTGVTCYGGFTGAIKITASGGSGSYKFTVNSGSSYTPYISGSTVSYTFTGLTANTYNVGVFDHSVGAQPWTTINLTGNTAITITNTSNSLPTTPGSPTGVMNFTVAGGVGPYNVILTSSIGTILYSGLTSGAFSKSSLIAGTYTVNVTDSNGCTQNTSFTLGSSHSTMSAVSATSTNPICNGGSGSIAVTVTNGSGNYYYSLNGGSTYNGPQSTNPFTITTGAGVYNLVIRDSADSVTVSGGTITITNPPTISLSTISGTTGYCGAAPTVFVKVTGFSGTPYISVNNGVTFTASSSAGTTFTLPANTVGTAQIKYYDSACPSYTGSTAFSYTGYTAIATGSTSVVAPICTSDLWKYTFTLTGGTGLYDYQLTPGTAWIGYTGGTQILIPPIYTGITFRDRGYTGCTTSYPIVTTAVSIISANVNIGTAIACSGGTGVITAAFSGGSNTSYEYQLMSGTTSSMTYTGSTVYPASTTVGISGLGAGYYSLQVRTSGSTCAYVTSSTVQLTDPPPIYLSGFTVNNNTCGGSSSVILTVTSTTTPSFSYSASGTTGLMGSLTSLGGNTYRQTFTTTGYTNDFYTFSYWNSCPFTGSTGSTVIMTSAPSMALSALNTIPPTCPGDYWRVVNAPVYHTPISASGFTYSLTGGTGTVITGSPTGTTLSLVMSGVTTGTGYSTLTITHSGCTSAVYSVPNSIVTPILASGTNTNPSCAGSPGSITLTVSGGLNAYISGVGPNIYQYQLMSGTTSTMTYTGSTTTFPGTSVNISGLGAGYYAFNVTRQTVTTTISLGTGTASITFTGCPTPTYVAPIQITVPTPVGGSVLGYSGVTSCATNNGAIQIAATGGSGSYTYSLNSGPNIAFTSPYTITGLAVNTYTIVIRDTNNCANALTITPVVISGASHPTLSGTYNPPTCGIGNASVTLSLTGGVSPYTYYSGTTALITTSSTTYTVYGLTPWGPTTGYTFSVNDNVGCTGSTNVVGSTTIVPLSVTASASGTTLTATIGGSYATPVQYKLYSGSTVSGGTYVTGVTVSTGSYSFAGLTAGGQYIIRVIDNNGCSGDSSAVTMPTPLNLYYFWYNLSYSTSGTSQGNYYYKGGGAATNYITQTPSGTTYIYTPSGPSASGRTTNEMINYYISSGVTNFGGGTLDLSTSIKSGGFTGTGSALTLTSTGVLYSGFMALLIPNVAPFTGSSQDFKATALAAWYPSGGAPTYTTVESKFALGTIMINGINYNLYNLQSSIVAQSSTSGFTINLR